MDISNFAEIGFTACHLKTKLARKSIQRALRNAKSTFNFGIQVELPAVHVSAPGGDLKLERRRKRIDLSEWAFAWSLPPWLKQTNIGRAVEAMKQRDRSVDR